MEKLIIVDENDEEVGLKESEECHLNNGILHRASTIFIFNSEGELLITQRSKNKRLWAGIWESSCSTHVKEKENFVQSGERRVLEELGINSKLKFLYKFRYNAKFKNIGSENEICALLVGYWNGKIRPNLNEIADYKWISLEDLKKELEKYPKNYAPWTIIAFQGYLKSKIENKAITKGDYFREMGETSYKTKEKLFAILGNKIQNFLLNRDLFYFIKIRENKLWARPWVIRMAYELGNGKNWQELVEIMSIFELENISNYQSNAAFDKKYGIVDENSRMRQVIASFISRNLVQLMSEQIKDKTLSDLILKSICEIDFFNYYGQSYEYNELNIKNFNIDMSWEDYLKIYITRCFLYGGTWIKNCLSVGYQLSKENNNEIKGLLEGFGMYLGTGWMILNDITDYFIKAGKFGMNYKTALDEFKDIWNGRVTLPIFHALKKSSKEEKEFLLSILNNKIEKKDENIRKVFDILLKRGSLNFSYSVANYFRKKAKKLIGGLPNTKRAYLSIFADAIKSNKFIFEFRKLGLRTIKLSNEVNHFLNNLNINFVCK